MVALIETKSRSRAITRGSLTQSTGSISTDALRCSQVAPVGDPLDDARRDGLAALVGTAGATSTSGRSDSQKPSTCET